MLFLARVMSVTSGSRKTAWTQGRAEALPLPDACATVVWAVSSLHDWARKSKGLAEIHRVLIPGGRLLVAERLAADGAHGHAAHGLTSREASALAGEIAATGFVDVDTVQMGRQPMIMVRARRPRL